MQNGLQVCCGNTYGSTQLSGSIPSRPCYAERAARERRRSIMNFPRSLYFEDLHEGLTFKSPALTVTEDSIIRFALEWDMQPFHVDVQAAKSSIFGSLVGSGLQTVMLTYKLYYQTGFLYGTAIAGLGFEEVRFLKPLRPNDTISVDCSVRTLQPSKQKDRGIVKVSLTTSNDKDAVLLIMTLAMLVARRPVLDQVATRITSKPSS